MAIQQPDNITQAAIWRFKHTNEGQVIIDWLRQCLADQDIKNRLAANEQIGRGQGRALCLNELIEMISSINPGKL